MKPWNRNLFWGLGLASSTPCASRRRARCTCALAESACRRTELDEETPFLIWISCACGTAGRRRAAAILEWDTPQKVLVLDPAASRREAFIDMAFCRVAPPPAEARFTDTMRKAGVVNSLYKTSCHDREIPWSGNPLAQDGYLCF
jgi:hypothetical protein